MKKINIIRLEECILNSKEMQNINGGGPGWCMCQIVRSGEDLPTASPNGVSGGDPGEPGNPGGSGCNIVLPCMIMSNGDNNPTAYIGQ